LLIMPKNRLVSPGPNRPTLSGTILKANNLRVLL
jgi:hypothetical protein